MLALRRALNNPERCQDVVSRRLIFCEIAQQLPTEDLLLECRFCGRFLAYCCNCTVRQQLEEDARRKHHSRFTDDSDEPLPEPCHYYKVAFVDGACLRNGQDNATAGIGIAIGRSPMMQFCIPIDDDIDPSFVRTSQRAELDLRRQARGALRESESKVTWVITSDSEYVVSGMTEWAPNWKSNGWRNSSGRRPKNLDLFQRLDEMVENYEREYGVRIAFWRISRVYNELADELAGLAANGHTARFEPYSDDGMATD